MSAHEAGRLVRKRLIDIALRRPGSDSAPQVVRSRSARVRWPGLSTVLDPLPWAVAGAVATRVYMAERATQDLHVLVLADHAPEVLMKLQASRAQDVADVSGMLGQASDDPLDAVRQVVAEHAHDLSEDLESLIELGRLEMTDLS